MQRRKFLTAAAASLPAITIAHPFTKLHDRPGKSFVVRADDGRFQERTKIGGTSPNDIKVSTKDTDGDLAIFVYKGMEKGGPPLHVHPDQDEVFFILEGEYLFRVGEEQKKLSAGDTIFLPRNIPHAFAQLTDTGKMHFLFTPAGKMEDFFRALGNLKGAPTPEEGAAIFARHGMKVVGPPLAY